MSATKMMLIGVLAWTILITVQAASRPEWADLSYIPADHESVYYAVASGNLLQEEKSAIRNRALAEIAAQIKVNISSVMSSVFQDTGEDVSEDTRYQINALTQAHFFGEDLHAKEFVDKDNTYWVYVYIDRQEYKQRIMERMQTGKQYAVRHLQSAQTLRNNGDMVMALKTCLKGLDALAAFRDLPLNVTMQSKRVNIWNALEHEFASIAERAELLPLQSQIEFTHKDDKKIGYKAIYSGSADKALASLPVRFNVSQGQAKITEKAYTDSKGLAYCIQQESRGNAITLSASIDWMALTPNPSIAELAASHSPATQNRMVRVFSSGPSLYFAVSATSDDAALADAARESGIIKSRLQNALKQNINASFSSAPEESDFILQLTLTVKSLGQLLKQYNSDMITVSITAHTSLIAPVSGQTLYTSPAVTVRNLGATNAQALTNALQKCAEQLETQSLPQLLDVASESN